MLKRFFAILLCIFLVPVSALATAFDPSAYSKEELETMLQAIITNLYEENDTLSDSQKELQALICRTYLELASRQTDSLLLYEDGNFALHYSSFDWEGDKFYVYLEILTTIKAEEIPKCTIITISANGFSFDTSADFTRDIHPDGTMKLPIRRDEFEKYPIEDVKTIALVLEYYTEKNPDGWESFTGNLVVLE